jgi:hypothetical protein
VILRFVGADLKQVRKFNKQTNKEETHKQTKQTKQNKQTNK